ncbi:MAG: TolC family protein [Bacteroidetes bacterium]|nr:TolC family protein [Bacteroidota bacterium]MBP7399113.1 TolC family protein [Chitinophagales bacterium]MBK7108645.1 TolC family protein [Bacteroidota bacterium]MBP8754548.1 TolC family protein [Chitinophagales bacterium]MBP9187977.1 TolC family protein [Chitinophagales bacterium]
MKFNSITLAVLLLLSVQAKSQTKQLSLEQTIAMALERNITLMQGQAGVQMGENAVKQSKLLLLPNLNFSTNYFWSFGRGIDYTSNIYVTQNFANNDYNLSSSMSLFQGGIINNTIKQTGYDLEVSKLNQQANIDFIELNTLLGYLQIMYSQEQLKVANEKLNLSNEQRSNSQKAFDAGSIPEGNLFTLESQIAANELEVVNAENILKLAFTDMKNLLQMEFDEEFEIVYPDITIFENALIAEIPSLQTVINEAIRTQPNIQKYEYMLQSKDLNVKIAQGYGLPSLTLVGGLFSTYSSASSIILGLEPEPYGEQIDNNFGQSVGLTLSIPIFNNGQVMLNKQQAELDYITTQLQEKVDINELKKNVTEAYTGLQAAAATYQASAKSVEAAQKSFEYEQKRFNVGQSTQLDFISASNALTQAETSLLSAKYDFIFKSKVIDYYMGKPLGF